MYMRQASVEKSTINMTSPPQQDREIADRIRRQAENMIYENKHKDVSRLQKDLERVYQTQDFKLNN